MAKIRVESSRESEGKTFDGSAVNDTHEQLCQRGHIASDVPAPLPNQMLDSLESYLGNIAAAAPKSKFYIELENSIICRVLLSIYSINIALNTSSSLKKEKI